MAIPFNWVCHEVSPQEADGGTSAFCWFVLCNCCRSIPATKIGLNQNICFVNRYFGLLSELLARPEIEPKTPLGNRLRNVRKRLGDPERGDFSEKLGISKNTLAAYERGESDPTASVLSAYKSVFGVSIIWLIAGEGDMFDDPATNLKHSEKIQSAIVKKLARLVKTMHLDSGITLKPEDIAAEATELYNYLCTKVDDLSDMKEVEAAFPLLEIRIKKQMAEAIAAPGTGKRTAS